jgi:esterase/lipase superfamily enzyme
MSRAVAALLLFAASGAAHAASLVKFEVVPDGSRLPPGDKIALRVLLGPDEAPLEVVVRPYLRTGRLEAGEVAAPFPVRSRDAERRADDGTYQIRSRLARSDGPIAEISLVVEYAHLDIPIGEYQLAYEVQALRDGAVLFATFSSWTNLEITAEPRTLDPVENYTVEVPQTVTDQVLVPDANTPGGFREISVERTQMTTEFRTRTLAADSPVRIEGGFHRRQTYSLYRHINQDIADQELSGARQDQWVPQPRVRIHYGTNRNVANAQARSTSRYGKDVRNSLEYGTLLVNIPVEVHVQGNIERPRWYQTEDPKKHFFVESLSSMSADAFRQLMRSQLQRRRHDVLIFVHGYHNTMEFAALRAAQIRHDIQFEGPMVLFAWPSQGTLGGYRRDERAARQSTSSFVQFLRQLLAAQAAAEQPGRIHLMAHSMGNRVLLEGLAEIGRSSRRPAAGAIGHVVLAAPDVDHSQFLLTFPKAAELAESVTMYFCRDDKALLASQTVHQDSRIGQRLVALPPLINVDAARANTSILGHDYFASRSPLLIDLQMHLIGNFPPARRPTLRKAAVQDFSYWSFP